MDDIKEPQNEPIAQEAGGKFEKVFNRQKLIGAVTEKTGLPRAKALAAIEAVFESMSHSLKGGMEVRVPGFGAFTVSERKAGKGRDPRTGAEILVPQSKSVRFRAGKGLREQVANTPVDSPRSRADQAHAGG